MSLYIYFCVNCVLNFIHFPTVLLVFFISKSSLYIACDMSCKYFFPVGCMCFDSLWWWLCPSKVCLILCNQIYLFVYSFCVLSQNQKDISYFRFLRSFWHFCHFIFSTYILVHVVVYTQVCSEVWSQLYVFSILSCPNTIYWKACIFPTVS